MCDQCSCAADAEVSEEHLLEHLDGVLKEYRGKPGALIPVLQTVQTMFGYLPQSALRRIATALANRIARWRASSVFTRFFPRCRAVNTLSGSAWEPPAMCAAASRFWTPSRSTGNRRGPNNAATASFRSRWAAASAPAGRRRSSW